MEWRNSRLKQQLTAEAKADTDVESTPPIPNWERRSPDLESRSLQEWVLNPYSKGGFFFWVRNILITWWAATGEPPNRRLRNKANPVNAKRKGTINAVHGNQNSWPTSNEVAPPRRGGVSDPKISEMTETKGTNFTNWNGRMKQNRNRAEPERLKRKPRNEEWGVRMDGRGSFSLAPQDTTFLGLASFLQIFLSLFLLFIALF